MIAADGWFDHCHVLARHPAALSVSDLARLVKTNSSKWIHETWPRLGGFGWQDGYAGFSVGKSEIDRIEAYIRNQKEHHRVETFEEEFVRFLTENGVAFDSKYLWPRKG
jgi:REP element-mobilizing transposase RayT